MIETLRVYCLDTNVLIQAWRSYYSPTFCPDYWDILNQLGQERRILLPNMVFEEIVRTYDDLTEWLKKSHIPRLPHDEQVIDCWKNILAKDPLHRLLVDDIKQRSLADPWVVAHALNEGACVVTKENKETALSTTRIKIPNVCENMGVPWMNDFQFIQELNIRFSCTIS
jgi:predicted nucleic acid-binding protein